MLALILSMRKSTITAMAAIGFCLAGMAHATDDRNLLKVAASSFPENWGNPFSSVSITRLPVQFAVFDPLTRVGAGGVLKPWLAQSWAQSGPLTWQITLRPDVVFSNGEAFDASAVETAITYVLSPQGRAEPVGRELSDIESARVVNERVVEIRTRRPDPLLPYRLSLLSVPAPAQWKKLGREDFAKQPVGTGPLMLESAAMNRIRMKAAPSSWRKPAISGVDFLIAVDPTSRRAALSTGAADVGFSTVAPSDFAAFEAEGGRVVLDRVSAVVAVAFNTQKFAAFQDPRVRRALTMAVNRQAIVDAIMGGKTIVASQPAARDWFGYNPNVSPLPYDPEQARALLREAGFEKGLAFEMEFPSGAVMYPDVFQTVAADLARIGVNMTVRMIPQQKLFENVQTGAWAGQAAAIPFASQVFDALYPQRQHTCLWHAPWFCDRDFTTQVEQAFGAADLNQRREQTQALMARAHDIAQAMYLYETVSFIGLSARVKEFSVDFGMVAYEDVRLRD